MPLVIDPLAVVPVAAKVTSLAIDPEGGWFAFGDASGHIHIHRAPDGAALARFAVEGGVAHLGCDPHGQLVVGTHTGDLYGMGLDGRPRWQQSMGGGCDLMAVAPEGDLIVVIDGQRTLHAVDGQGRRLWHWNGGELVRLAIERHGGMVAVADDGGTVTVMNRGGQSVFQRPPKAHGDERVVALGFLADGHLVVSSESLVVAQGADDDNALEWYNSVGQAVHQHGLPVRCDILDGAGPNLRVGLINGEVLEFDATLQPSVRHRARYAISALASVQNDLLVGAWFHLSRVPAEDDPLWQVEHTGIVDHLVVSRLGRFVAVAGDDRNEMTAQHSVQLLDPNQQARYVDEDGLQEMDEDLRAFADDAGGVDHQRISDASAYDTDGADDLAGLLTAEELASFEDGGGAAGGDDQDDLMAMLSADVGGGLAEPTAGGSAGMTDLLGAMQAEGDGVSNLPPVCDAGDDQRVVADGTGTAIVLLDGSRSYDPDGDIEHWQWNDDYGRNIGSTSQVRLKLPLGAHRFQLTVTDDDGASTTDSTSIIVIEGGG